MEIQQARHLAHDVFKPAASMLLKGNLTMDTGGSRVWILISGSLRYALPIIVISHNE